VDDAFVDNCAISNADDASPKVHVEPSNIHLAPLSTILLLPAKKWNGGKKGFGCLRFVGVEPFVRCQIEVRGLDAGLMASLALSLDDRADVAEIANLRGAQVRAGNSSEQNVEKRGQTLPLHAGLLL